MYPHWSSRRQRNRMDTRALIARVRKLEARADRIFAAGADKEEFASISAAHEKLVSFRLEDLTSEPLSRALLTASLLDGTVYGANLRIRDLVPFRFCNARDPGWREPATRFSTVVCLCRSGYARLHAAEGTRKTGEARLTPVARPRYQRGHLRPRGGGWSLRFREDHVGPSGRHWRVQRSSPLGESETKKQTRRTAEAYLRPLNQRARQPQRDITPDDFWTRFFEPEVIPTLKPSSYKMCTSFFTKHLAPHIGPEKLSDITPLSV
jgi:hypothetical protein